MIRENTPRSPDYFPQRWQLSKVANQVSAQQDYIKVILQLYKERNMQRYASELDGELTQGKFDSIQRREIDEKELL